MEKRDIDNRFTPRPPNAENDQPNRYEQLLNAARSYAHLINDLVNDGREKSLAITSLEQASFWANAGVAREDD